MREYEHYTANDLGYLNEFCWVFSARNALAHKVEPSTLYKCAYDISHKLSGSFEIAQVSAQTKNAKGVPFRRLDAEGTASPTFQLVFGMATWRCTMVVATYRVEILGRGSNRSAVQQSAYGSGAKVIGISSVVGAAAYRAGEQHRDQEQGRTYDYSSREDVRYTEILAPEHAPEWVQDRATLWNAVEQRENRKNSQLARSLIMGLPRELTLEENIALLREHVQEQFVSKGMVADIAIHDSIASDGGRNPHAHVLLTMRGFNPDGTWQRHKNGGRERSWNSYNIEKTHTDDGKFIPANQRFDSTDIWRNAWEEKQNEYLAQAGAVARISMKSYQEQGIDKLPTVHMGYRANLLESQGIPTRVGNWNRAVEAENAKREREQAIQWLDALPTPANDNQPPALTQDKVQLDEETKVKDANKQTASLPQHRNEAFSEKSDEVGSSASRTHAASSDSFWDKQQRWLKGTMVGWQRYWDKQTDWIASRYHAIASTNLWDKLKRDQHAAEESQHPQQTSYRPKPRSLWSQEQREDYERLRPYLQQQADLTRKEQAQAVAVTLQYAQQKRAQERQAEMQRIAQRQANFRYRSIEQDRPIPSQQRERTRERGR
ncbi:MAG: hypothetical protein CL607_15740 [Anaerolineaceae bacterium]|nr:hypothetical protein [Anaerolineaceae bacterium]